MKKILIIIPIILALAGVSYFGYKFIQQNTLIPDKQACTMEAKICPDGSSVGRSGPNCEFAPCPSPEVIPQVGTVTGRLCYPSDFLPPGEIVAKDLGSGKEYIQNYVGSMAGGKSTYTFELPVGIYHLRYQGHASTKNTEIFTSGYYDECAKTMHTDQCTPDDGHINIDVEVEEGKEIGNVDLCDFYYNQAQQALLEKDF